MERKAWIARSSRAMTGCCNAMTQINKSFFAAFFAKKEALSCFAL
jgi:hypothetical protein